ncbi:MAG TPA: hypothetical protein VIF88_15560 [Methylocystis sp.]|jgi:hypothetical protein
MKAILLAIFGFMATSVALAQPGPPGGPHRPPPDRAAHIRLKQGEAAVDVKCPDETTLKDCADVALRLLDRVSGQKPPAETPR